MKKRNLFRLILVVGTFLGILLNLLESTRVISTISYYTIQSNLLVLITYMIIILNKKPLSEKMLVFKSMVTQAILLTFIVYHLLLDPFFIKGGLNLPLFSNFLVHTFTPIMVLIDDLFFTKHDRLKWNKAFIYLLIPLTYLIYVFIYAGLGGIFIYEDTISRYPYFFLNPDLIGMTNVLLYLTGISIFLYGLSIGFNRIELFIQSERRKKS